MKISSKLKLTLVILAAAIVVFAARPYVMTTYYRWVYEGYLSQAVHDVDTALTGFDATYVYSGDTSCSKETIRTSPSSLDRYVNNASLWLTVNYNCMTKEADGTIALNHGPRMLFSSRTAAMETSLQKNGWTGNGWLKAYGYELSNYPATIDPQGIMGIYSKKIPGGHCWFDFRSDYVTSGDTTVVSTYIWCDMGYPTFAY